MARFVYEVSLKEIYGYVKRLAICSTLRNATLIMNSVDYKRLYKVVQLRICKIPLNEECGDGYIVDIKYIFK